MNANGQPFNILKNPIVQHLHRANGENMALWHTPIHRSPETAEPVPVAVGDKFRAYWVLDGKKTSEMEHLAGLGAFLNDPPRVHPPLPPNGGSHFAPGTWFWADGLDGSDAIEDLDPTERFYVYNKEDGSLIDWLTPDEYADTLKAMERMGKQTYCQQAWGVDDVDIAGWTIRKHYFRHVCDRLLLAQNCYLEAEDESEYTAAELAQDEAYEKWLDGEDSDSGSGSESGSDSNEPTPSGTDRNKVRLKFTVEPQWHAPRRRTINPLAKGKVRPWTGPASDVWPLQANRYANFIPLCYHQHRMSSTNDGAHTRPLQTGNPGPRQSNADRIVEEWQSGFRANLPPAWHIRDDVPVYRVIFKTPQKNWDYDPEDPDDKEFVKWENEKHDGGSYTRIEEDYDDAAEYVETHAPDRIIYWSEVGQDAKTIHPRNKMTATWNVMDPDNIVHQLFFVHRNRRQEGTRTIQDKLSIPLGAAFDLVVIVEAYEWVTYELMSPYIDDPQEDIEENWGGSEKPGERRRWEYMKPFWDTYWYRMRPMARIVKALPPQEIEEGGE